MKISRAIVTLLATALVPRRDTGVAGEGLRGSPGAAIETTDDHKAIAAFLASASPDEKSTTACTVADPVTSNGGVELISTGVSGAGTLTGMATFTPTVTDLPNIGDIDLPGQCIVTPSPQPNPIDLQVSATVPEGKEAVLVVRVIKEVRVTEYCITIPIVGKIVYWTKRETIIKTVEGTLENVMDSPTTTTTTTAATTTTTTTTAATTAATTTTTTTTPPDPGSMPDPHIFTWKGIIYNYHGQCDLIYTTCPSFDNNKGLHIHMRTKFVMPEEWSTITNLAVKIGEDTFELQEDGTYHVNGEVNPAVSDTANLAGHEMKQKTRHNGHNFSIALGNSIYLNVANYIRETRNSLAFKITGVHDHRDNGGTSLSDCVGLTSTWDHPEEHRFLVGRSGMMYSAAERVEFGPEWQVDRTQGDPMLFADDVGQQLPDQGCIDSKTDLGHRRLLDDAEAEALGRQAEDACRHLNGQNTDLFEACVSDILITGDVSFAEEPWYGGGDEF